MSKSVSNHKKRKVDNENLMDIIKTLEKDKFELQKRLEISLEKWNLYESTSDRKEINDDLVINEENYFRWECLLESGWQPYDLAINQILEDEYLDNFLHKKKSTRAKSSLVYFLREGIPYFIDYERNIQKRNDGKFHTERNVRRIDVTSNVQSFMSNDVSSWSIFPLEIKNHNLNIYEIKASHISNKVTKETQEFNLACAHFCRLLNQSPSIVIQIDVLQYNLSSIVRKQYEKTKCEFFQQGKFHEYWVFHGTTIENIELIRNTGFKVGGKDDGIMVKNGSSNGFGVYTAVGPRAPMNYAYGTNKVILAKALIGRQKSIVFPDNTVDSWLPQQDFVVFKDGKQLLPCYVVTYSLKGTAP